VWDSAELKRGENGWPLRHNYRRFIVWRLCCE
jgi:hypothetical protein